MFSALILVKSDSSRLPNKNILPFHGTPMYVVNLKKCLKLFKKVYVSSDSTKILKEAVGYGAVGIKRSNKLCGSVPNIPVYKHALKSMEGSKGIVAVQANSPNIDIKTIRRVKSLMESGLQEVMTCHPTYKIYGSVWALTNDRILNYYDPYAPEPDALIVDDSVDIHNREDYEEALCRATSQS